MSMITGTTPKPDAWLFLHEFFFIIWMRIIIWKVLFTQVGPLNMV